MRLGINGRFYGARTTGVQRFAGEVCGRLFDLVDDVVLFLPAGVNPPSGLPAGVRVDRGRLPGQAWELGELARRAREAACDVVLHPGGTAPPAAEPPAVIVVHDLIPLSHPEAFTRRYRLWHRIALVGPARTAAALITPSRWSAQEVRQRLGVAAERVHVVRQGVEPFDEPAGPDAVRAVRAKYGLPERYLLAVGDGDRRKNLAFLETVLNRWAAERAGARPALVCVGTRSARVHGRGALPGATSSGRDRVNEARPATAQTAAAATLDSGGTPAGAVLRLGYLPDPELHALYTGAAAFCFPSLVEGFGRPPLEAMACGTPAIVADYGAAVEVLGDAATMLPLEAERWIDALDAVLEPGPARAARVAAGRAHARRFRWDEAAVRVLDICRGVATAPAGSVA